MDEGYNQAGIFLPVLALVALTLVAFLRMSVARVRAVKEQRRDPAYYRAFLGEPEPEYAVVAVRHYGNLFELPVLFYAACITTFTLGAVSLWPLVLAWAFVAARIAQSLVHLTYNNTMHRGGAFVLGWLFVTALWIELAFVIVERLS